ncbi:unnamed protein product [Parajaminaea phylloscopi]
MAASLGGSAGASTKPSSASATGTSPAAKIALANDTIAGFRPSKVFKSPTFIQPGRHFTSLDFDDRGEMCVTSSDDETIQLFNVKTGKHAKTLNSKKYGVDLVRFTHKSSTVIYASTKADDTIRYHSLHDNRYIQYFRGHTSRVCSLQMNPIDDTFLSAAVAESVKMWDLRSPNAQGSLPVHGHPTVAFDPSGQVFALGLSERCVILLYDSRKFTEAPFLTLPLNDDAYLSRFSMPPRQPIITSLSFSPSASSGHLLVGTSGDQHYVLDSFNNAYMWRLVGHEGLAKATAPPPLDAEQEAGDAASGMQGQKSSRRSAAVPEAGLSSEEVTWSPDGRFVLAGSANGQVCVWEIPDKDKPLPPPGSDVSLNPIARLEGHSGPVRALKFSPRTALFASAGLSVAFWLPPAPSTGKSV